MKTNNVLMLAFDPKLNGYSPERNRQFLFALRERVSALPGVQAVSYVDSVPLSLGGVNFDMETSSPEGSKKSVVVDYYRVGRGYFGALGIPMLHGRDFELSDGDGDVILNEKAAAELFPKGGAVGSNVTSEKQQYRVIAVVKTAKSRRLGEAPQPCAYLSLEGAPEKVMSFFGTSLLVKTAGKPERYQRAVHDEISKLDPTLAITGTETMQEHVDKALLLPKVCATLLGVFGLVGLALATVGLYGVLSYMVRARSREIGIRVALGAEKAGVLGLIARQGLALVGIGMVIGLAIGSAVTRFATSFLYGIGAHDLVTFIGVSLALLVVTLIAVLGPARRAMRIEPMRALRYE